MGHEAGHAVVGALLPDYDSVTKISIVPRGAAGGLTFFAPSEERLESGLYSRSYLEDLKAKTLSGALMSKSDFSGSNMQEAVLSKVYAVDSDFSGVDFTSAVIDRAALMGSKFVGANFYNAVFTGVGVEGSDFTDARFEDALIGSQDAKFLCENPTVKGDARLDIGCRN